MAEELRELALFVRDFRLEDLPEEDLSAARFCVLDSLGAALGAAGSQEIKAILNTWQEWGGTGKNGRTAAAWAHGLRVSVRNALLINGLMSHELELDDVHTGSKSHVGAVVIPTAWTMADALGAPGKAFLEAVVVFKMQFYAPFPFFSAFTESSYLLGGITKCFRFPVNYSKPHRFGSRGTEKYVNVLNSGDVRVPYKLTLRSEGVSTNPIITNLATFSFIKINGVINIGEYITIYRDRNNVLRSRLHMWGTLQPFRRARMDKPCLSGNGTLYGIR